MDTKPIDSANKLAAHMLLCKVFQSVFAVEPSIEQIESFRNDTVHKAFEAIKMNDDPMVSEMQNTLQKATGKQIEKLQEEYTRLFIGPGKLIAPPWESVYKGEGGLLMQKSTLEVREAYRRQGFKAALRYLNPDDHISTELGFLSAMFQRAVESVHAQKLDSLNLAIEAIASFYGEHLGTWANRFAKLLEEHSPQSYYTLWANLLTRYLSVLEKEFSL